MATSLPINLFLAEVDWSYESGRVFLERGEVGMLEGVAERVKKKSKGHITTPT